MFFNDIAVNLIYNSIYVHMKGTIFVKNFNYFN